MKARLLFFAAFFLSLASSGQDSSEISWQVKSFKTGEKEYQLHFTAVVSNGWQLYAPNQKIADFNTTEVLFADSSVVSGRTFEDKGESKKIRNALFDNQEYKVYDAAPVEFTAYIKINGTVPAALIGTFKYTYGKGDEFYPLEDFNFQVALEGGETISNRIKIETIDISNPVNNCGVSGRQEKKSLLTIFLLGFLGGLVALITPCVFPMVPLTVSFFTKKAGDKSKGISNAVMYGLFILLIYASFSIPFHAIGKVSPTIYNDISTNIYLNIIFFIIFIVFAISFFGYFEITLPSGLANRANTRQGTSMFGIFFMALTLAIVSFSCTGPILGTLLVGTASEGAWPLTIGLTGFGLALGLPFALFAMFPQWLQSLPRSGGWLNTVKVVLGFIEVALAIKFLSNADLVSHWGILKRETFFGAWVITGLGLFAYLMGWIKFPHDDAGQKISLGRRIFAFAVLAFTVYLMPGVTNTKMANLSLVSGFPPPHCYSIYKNPVNCDEPIKDYEEALKLAKEKNKPLLIDFTGWACVNCRKMEENVWPDKKVRELMEKYILVSLYVDDKKKLPISRQFIYHTKDSLEKKIITVGDKWSTFQTENFNASSQPWYNLISPDEKLLTPPVGYTPDAAEFAQWLQCGLDAFNSIK
ncbi:MAG: cytochrome c biogenesis protein CcdA [Chitinophagaceae bacterium]|nr:cytochrome c biogenesis protein CcdA [Chitinophagaceae bacterium]